MRERCKQISKQMSEWPNKNVFLVVLNHSFLPCQFSSSYFSVSQQKPFMSPGKYFAASVAVFPFHISLHLWNMAYVLFPRKRITDIQYPVLRYSDELYR